MAASKLLVAAILLSLLFLGAKANGGIGSDAAAGDATGSALLLELEQLRPKISALESRISETTQELRSKDESIAWMEKILQEKLANIASLESEIEVIQKKGAVDAKDQVGKAHTKAHDLEKQIEKLGNEILNQNKRKDALEARAGDAEDRMKDLTQKLESFQKTIDEQRSVIRKTERALQLAEEEYMRAQQEATLKYKELTEVYGAWLPPWLAAHIDSCQDSVTTIWNEHVKPAVNTCFQKTLEKSAEVQKWAKPHLETAQTKLIPAMKKKFLELTTSIEPFVQNVSIKALRFYEASKSTVRPHFDKARQLADPYFKEAKKLSKPYIDQVVTITKPHVEKARTVLKPYTKRASRAYRKFRKSATTYHRQVQATVQEKLKIYEATKPFATKEFASFMASALLVLPILFLYKLLSAIFCKKTRKPKRSNHANHGHRRPKRRHAEK